MTFKGTPSVALCGLALFLLAGGVAFFVLLAGTAQAAPGIYYEPDIKEIIRKDCSRCHSGTLRNLMDYNSVLAYADSGMLAGMVQGLMRQFAGADAQTILDWVDAGAPEKAPAAAKAGAKAAAAQKIYFEPTILEIIRKDCGRCHSKGRMNLLDWDSVRAVVQNGRLEAMLRGPMRRFAGADMDIILAWIDSGAPENPPRVGQAPKPAAFGKPGPPSGVGRAHGGPPPGGLTYSGEIQGLLAENCLRCHMGPFRKMTTYEEVKMYVDNGLLETLVQPGGPMNRFAGPQAMKFLDWIRAGAPR